MPSIREKVVVVKRVKPIGVYFGKEVVPVALLGAGTKYENWVAARDVAVSTRFILSHGQAIPTPPCYPHCQRFYFGRGSVVDWLGVWAEAASLGMNACTTTYRLCHLRKLSNHSLPPSLHP